MLFDHKRIVDEAFSLHSSVQFFLTNVFLAINIQSYNSQSKNVRHGRQTSNKIIIIGVGGQIRLKTMIEINGGRFVAAGTFVSPCR